MVLCIRIVLRAVVVFAIAAVPAYGSAQELAMAQGPISISEAPPGLRARACSKLVVEARDALDNHLIAQTQPSTDESANCRYALTVPAQKAVWLRLQIALVTGAHRVEAADAPTTVAAGRGQGSTGTVALRFTIVASNTYFFAPNEVKTVVLSYGRL